ncbi:MAG: capsular polysaccharide synthesis protein [Comamonas thiooxydans]
MSFAGSLNIIEASPLGICMQLPPTVFRSLFRLLQSTYIQGRTDYQLPEPLVIEGNSCSFSTSSSIPKVIWTYWSNFNPDSTVIECIATWRIHCSEYDVRVINPSNIAKYIPDADMPSQFIKLHPTKQADWLRLYLVARYGGFWLDASILLTQSLEWLRCKLEGKVEFTGFYLQKYTHDINFPIIESWAFGAIPGSPFIKEWQREFHEALIVKGPDAYLKKVPYLVSLRQGIEDPNYLLIHIAAQNVLRRQKSSTLHLFKAEDTAYFYHRSLHWKWYLLYPQLCLMEYSQRLAPLVKLRGGERRHFSALFNWHGDARKGSIWQRALHKKE